MRLKGPLTLLAGWILHDVEEALAFPSTCDRLAERTGLDGLRIDRRQSWVAVGLMGLLVTTACASGVRTSGRSRLYRATVAGLEGHVLTHLLASATQRRYTAGVATAVPIMWPTALVARRELQRSGAPLTARDYATGTALLLPAAIACQVLARRIPTEAKP